MNFGYDPSKTQGNAATTTNVATPTGIYVNILFIFLFIFVLINYYAFTLSYFKKT